MTCNLLNPSRIQYLLCCGRCPIRLPDGNWRRYLWKVAGHSIARSQTFYSEGSREEGPFAILGSSGYIEIAVAMGSAAKVLGARSNDDVIAVPIEPMEHRDG